jgi:gamma-glutamyl:cysteine ligase YbdK (ATP-grasp superfamily)
MNEDIARQGRHEFMVETIAASALSAEIDVLLERAVTPAVLASPMTYNSDRKAVARENLLAILNSDANPAKTAEHREAMRENQPKLVEAKAEKRVLRQKPQRFGNKSKYVQEKLAEIQEKHSEKE